MNIDLLSGIVGGLVSILFAIIPGLKEWYNRLSAEYKRLVMVGVLAVVSLALYGLSCAGALGKLLPGVQLTCDSSGAWLLVRLFIEAVVVNQGTYSIFPFPSRKAKLDSKEWDYR